MTAVYDAIHLTVAGYLSTAGRAIQKGSAYTVLAGWDPDETWWLTDSPRRLGEPVTWLDTRDEELYVGADGFLGRARAANHARRQQVPFVADPVA